MGPSGPPRANRQVPLYSSQTPRAPLATHSVCLSEKHMNARPGSLHHPNGPSTYYVLARGMQRQDKVSPPEGAPTIIGKTDKTV